MAKKQVKSVSSKQVIGVGVGIAALSAAAYLIFGPDGKKNRKAIKGWTVKMKGEIIEKFEEAKELTEPIYNQIVDKVHEKYSKIQSIDKDELESTIKEIKKNWKALKKETVGKKSKKSPVVKNKISKNIKK